MGGLRRGAGSGGRLRWVCRSAAPPSEKALAMCRAACAEDGDGRRRREPLECGGSARVAELVDAPDLGSGALGRVGSSPTLRTGGIGGVFEEVAVPSNKMIGEFSKKPKTDAYCQAIDAYVTGLGSVKRELRSQVSYSVNRKFLWMWAYEKTGDGTLYLNVTLDHREEFPGIHRVTQVSARRWNHHVVVKSLETANSSWLRELIKKGFEFSCR